MKKVMPFLTPFLLFLGISMILLFDSCLTIVHFTAPDSATAGTMIEAQVRIKSDLNRAAGDPIAWNLFLSPDPYLDPEDLQLSTAVSYAGLPLASYLDLSASFTIPENTSSGEYYLLSVVNETTVANPGAWAILDFGTNLADRRIRIEGPSTGQADLLVSEVRLSGMNRQYYESLSYTPGQSIRSWATVENRGDQGSPAGSLQVYLSPDAAWSSDDVLLTEAEVPALAAGERQEVYQLIPLPADADFGNRYLVLVADAGQVTEEGNEVNNVAFRFFNLRENRADHRLNTMTAPGLVLAGAPMMVSGQVSGVRVGTSSTVGLYLSEDDQLDAGDPFLDAFGTTGEFNHTLNLPADIATGTYFLIANANDDLLIPEYDFSNNAFALRFFLVSSSSDAFACDEIIDQLQSAAPNHELAAKRDRWTEELITPFQLNVYPNPTSDYLHASVTLKTPADRLEVELLDTDGRSLHHVSFIDLPACVFERTFNLAPFPAGSYVLRITNGKNVESKRFVVKR